MFSSSQLYREEIESVCCMDLPFSMLKNKSVLITGASGLIGTYLIDVLMQKSLHEHLGITVYAVGRHEAEARMRFKEYFSTESFFFLPWDVNQNCLPKVHADFVIHAASNTHPKAYANDPVGSILTNLLGLRNVLEYSRVEKAKRVLFLSSVEIYGQAWKNTDCFDETYCGYLDCNTLRAGYPEGKRAGEALCQAYISKYDMDIVIPRLSRVYGVTMKQSDSKAMSQFIRNSVNKEDIVLKSEGKQRFSYTYAPDAAAALLFLLCHGQKGEAYNVAGKEPTLTLKEIAGVLAAINHKDISFQQPEADEKKGFSKADTAILSVKKINDLGWNAQYDIATGLRRTVEIMREDLHCHA